MSTSEKGWGGEKYFREGKSLLTVRYWKLDVLMENYNKIKII